MLVNTDSGSLKGKGMRIWCSSIPHFPSPVICLILTSADTDQVASSLRVSMEPLNRKQVRPDTPSSMLNVAVKEHRALFWLCQATSAQAWVWGTEGCFLSLCLCISIWSASVLCVFIAAGRRCQVCMHWEHFWQGRFSACVDERERGWLTSGHCFVV